MGSEGFSGHHKPFHGEPKGQLSVAFPSSLDDVAFRRRSTDLESRHTIPTSRHFRIGIFEFSRLMMTGKPLTSDVVLDETHYSDSLFCEKINQWYRLSKTLAEQAAWKFAEGNGIDLVTIHPGFAIGPLLRPTLNLAIKFLQNLMSGIETPFINYTFVDVRDIASAHIQAFEVPSAKGRYCLVAQVADGTDTLKILQQLYPTLCLPDFGNPPDSKFQVSIEKARGLGITFLWRVSETPLKASRRRASSTLEFYYLQQFVTRLLDQLIGK